MLQLLATRHCSFIYNCLLSTRQPAPLTNFSPCTSPQSISTHSTTILPFTSAPAPPPPFATIRPVQLAAAAYPLQFLSLHCHYFAARPAPAVLFAAQRRYSGCNKFTAPDIAIANYYCYPPNICYFYYAPGAPFNFTNYPVQFTAAAAAAARRHCCAAAATIPFHQLLLFHLAIWRYQIIIIIIHSIILLRWLLLLSPLSNIAIYPAPAPLPG